MLALGASGFLPLFAGETTIRPQVGRSASTTEIGALFALVALSRVNTMNRSRCRFQSGLALHVLRLRLYDDDHELKGGSQCFKH